MVFEGFVNVAGRVVRDETALFKVAGKVFFFQRCCAALFCLDSDILVAFVIVDTGNVGNVIAKWIFPSPGLVASLLYIEDRVVREAGARR